MSHETGSSAAASYWRSVKRSMKKRLMVVMIFEWLAAVSGAFMFARPTDQEGWIEFAVSAPLAAILLTLISLVV